MALTKNNNNHSRSSEFKLRDFLCANVYLALKKLGTVWVLDIVCS